VSGPNTINGVTQMNSNKVIHVKALRESGGCYGILDEEAAARILRYFKRRVEDPTLGHHGATVLLLDQFMIDHGQCISFLYHGELTSIVVDRAKRSPRSDRIIQDPCANAA
jgi:hypothetical protein